MSNRRHRTRPSPLQKAAARRAAIDRQRRRLVIGSVVGVMAVAVLVAVMIVVRSRATHAPVRTSADATRLGCTSCHTADGSPNEGPTWQGLRGSTVRLQGKPPVVADDSYIRRSILEPGADIVAGYGNAMPAKAVTPAELDRLVAFISSLGDPSPGA